MTSYFPPCFFFYVRLFNVLAIYECFRQFSIDKTDQCNKVEFIITNSHKSKGKFTFLLSKMQIVLLKYNILRQYIFFYINNATPVAHEVTATVVLIPCCIMGSFSLSVAPSVPLPGSLDVHDDGQCVLWPHVGSVAPLRSHPPR